MVQNLKSRIEKLKLVKPRNDLDREIGIWISDYLISLANNATAKAKRHESKTYWKNENICKIISPSDVGIHNTIRTNIGIAFVDFEYSGWDDICKFVCDWILQPEYLFSKIQARAFVNEISNCATCINDGWISRCDDIADLIKVKWITIMLKDYFSNKIDCKQWGKIKKYYKESSTEYFD